MNRRLGLIVAALVAYALVVRLLPHPANFAPLMALAIFSGAKLPKGYAIGAVLAAAVLSDAIVGLYDLPVMLVVWACYVAAMLASHCWLKRLTLLRAGTVTLASSVFFFVITNLAVWAFGDLYPRTIAGLQHCFILALPFFRNSLASDIFYTVALFGVAEWLSLLSRRTSATPIWKFMLRTAA